MSTIGTFTKTGDNYNGTLQTLAFSVKVKIVAVPKEADNAPDYRITASGMEIGAGWKRQSVGNKPYISVKLDDPSFASPVNGRLIDTEAGGATLFWSRRNAD